MVSLVFTKVYEAFIKNSYPTILLYRKAKISSRFFAIKMKNVDKCHRLLLNICVKKAKQLICQKKYAEHGGKSPEKTVFLALQPTVAKF